MAMRLTVFFFLCLFFQNPLSAGLHGACLMVSVEGMLGYRGETGTGPDPRLTSESIAIHEHGIWQAYS